MMFPEMPLGPRTPDEKKPKTKVDAQGRLKFPNGIIHSTGTDFSDGTSFSVNLADLEDQGTLGEGQFAIVKKFRHKKTGVVMAVKRIHFDSSESTFKHVMTELSVLHEHSSNFIVDFYGAFFIEAHVYYCVEYMDLGSLDKVYGTGIPEKAICKIAAAVIQALMFLHDELRIMHRDVRPSNILLNSKGEVKLCDFNVSGNLENSLAKTVVGCERYMSPERIQATKDNPYGVGSDIWSFGISLVEMATGNFPYPKTSTIFAHLTQILESPAPTLSKSRYSPQFCHFVEQCLVKDPAGRATLADLAAHPFLSLYPDYSLREWCDTLPRQQQRSE